MFKKFRKNEKGFTLAELLIVVAIIGVLVAISIPIFTSQLEKAREATDAANIRAAYAELSAAAITGETIAADQVNGNITIKAVTPAETGNTDYTATVQLTQQQEGWQSDSLKADGAKIGGMAAGTPKAKGTATIKVPSDGSSATLTY